MLIGEQRCAMDEKGRLSFPARFREEMGESFVVTRWLDDCLVAFPETEWERISDLLAEKSMVKSRDVQLFLYSGAAEARPDKLGRILVPAELREHAGLEKEICVIGLRRHVEIWDATAWQSKRAKLSSKAIAKAMEELEL